MEPTDVDQDLNQYATFIKHFNARTSQGCVAILLAQGYTGPLPVEGWSYENHLDHKPDAAGRTGFIATSQMSEDDYITFTREYVQFQQNFDVPKEDYADLFSIEQMEISEDQDGDLLEYPQSRSTSPSDFFDDDIFPMSSSVSRRIQLEDEAAEELHAPSEFLPSPSAFFDDDIFPMSPSISRSIQCEEKVTEALDAIPADQFIASSRIRGSFCNFCGNIFKESWRDHRVLCSMATYTCRDCKNLICVPWEQHQPSCSSYLATCSRHYMNTVATNVSSVVKTSSKDVASEDTEITVTPIQSESKQQEMHQ
jgi:hypothetical protein